MTALRRGFTLVEVVLAAVIVAAIAGGAVTALSQAAKARERVGARQQAFSRANAAADRIAEDLRSAARDADLLFASVRIADGKSSAGDADELLVVSRSLRRVRPLAAGAEGGRHEVQYRLAPGGGAPGGAGGASLWRRSDPIVDDYPDAGGVAAVVADSIVSLKIEAADEAAWYDTWDSDFNGYPHAVRITVTAADDARRYTLAARRVVALDRVPIPTAPPEEAALEEGAPQ